MKKISKIAAFIFALSLSATVMTACGDSKDSKKSEPKSVEDIDEKDLEDALNKLDEETSKELAKEKEEATEAETEPTTAAEIVYEPTEEIKNASFRSGYIQIGDTVFRTGGYITVADFVDKYGDKFDMSEIALDEYLKGNKHKEIVLSSLEDPRIKIKLLLVNMGGDENDRIKIADTVIQTIEPYGAIKQLCFYPTGVSFLNYDDIKALTAELGLEESRSSYGIEAEKYSESNDHIYAAVYAEEENLYGKKPIFGYKFFFDANTLEGTKIEIQYRDV